MYPGNQAVRASHPSSQLPADNPIAYMSHVAVETPHLLQLPHPQKCQLN